ncbi:MAG: DegT/DnrJ/EryC1/StrS family aminotransferase, partial [Candidatus Omnitrophica bacterium]|nr:DegT/DnrJ/EryC1/StrS family aminotransferase [Candidatus Omnitrophota bacterium]
MPSITFIATPNVVLQNRMKPVFVDIDPATATGP